MIFLITIVAVAALAFANGANDVSKGIATLAGSRRATYRQALLWGTLWTGAGALAAVLVSFGLVRVFTSAIVTDGLLALPEFPLAVAIAAFAWVVFASVTGLPVSTTHAMTGAIVGVALAGGGSDSIRWGLLLSAIAAPLALSPMLSAVLGYSCHGVARRFGGACVCAESQAGVTSVNVDGTVAITSFPMFVASVEGCEPGPGRLRFIAGHLTHWGAAAAISFARGVNDNPKIAALGMLAVASTGAGTTGAFVVTAVAMTIGSALAGLRVSRTLGDRVVHMHGDTGLAGAFVTAGLVLAASTYAMPVSTTHVATGAIVGAGVRQGAGAVRWDTVAALVAAWVVTLPVCAALGAAAGWLLQIA